MGQKGFVYLIGAGPGDPGLFTIKGKEALTKAEVIVYDRLIGAEILHYGPAEAEYIYVGKASSDHALPQDEINQLLVDKAQQGKIVVRLKGGDPFVFGRGGEEALVLHEHGVEFEIVPGISSAIAVPAYAGIPVTHRDMASSFAVITGHEKPGKAQSSITWEKLTNAVDTLVFLMGVENLGYIVDNLVRNGRSKDTPVALIRRGTFPDQEVIEGTLDNIVARVKDAQFQPPAIILVGPTIQLRSQLQWREKKPLWGATIVVTRARAQASELVHQIEAAGGQAIEFPSIEIVKEDLSALHSSLERILEYRWLIFTSVNGVEIFFEEMLNKQIDIRQLKGVKICAIGPATERQLAGWGLIADLVPDEYLAEGILVQLQDKIKPGDKVLLPRAKGARMVLPESLAELGASVDEVIVYQAVTASHTDPDNYQRIRNGQVDYITFTSSSTVTNFVKIMGADIAEQFKGKVEVACIGPITANTARENGFTVDIIPDQYTIPALLESIKADYKG